MKCNDCGNLGWGNDEGELVYGWCKVRQYCPDLGLEKIVRVLSKSGRMLSPRSRPKMPSCGPSWRKHNMSEIIRASTSKPVDFAGMGATRVRPISA